MNSMFKSLLKNVVSAAGDVLSDAVSAALDGVKDALDGVNDGKEGMTTQASSNKATGALDYRHTDPTHGFSVKVYGYKKAQSGNDYAFYENDAKDSLMLYVSSFLTNSDNEAWQELAEVEDKDRLGICYSWIADTMKGELMGYPGMQGDGCDADPAKDMILDGVPIQFFSGTINLMTPDYECGPSFPAAAFAARLDDVIVLVNCIDRTEDHSRYAECQKKIEEIIYTFSKGC